MTTTQIKATTQAEVNPSFVKEFKRRSSATDVLREVGIKARDYNLFIEPGSEPGAVLCKIGLAHQHVLNVNHQMNVESEPGVQKTGTGKVKAPKAPRAPKAKKEPTEAPATPFKRYTVAMAKMKYLETDKGVQARAVIDVNGKQFCHFDDFPERLMAVVHFNSKKDREQFLADARAAGFTAREDDFVISEFARKIVHDHEARWLAEQEAAKRAQKAGGVEPSFPTAPVIKKPVKGEPAKKAPAKTKAPAPAKKSARTVTSVARELIVAGKTNEEVWDALVKEFKLDDGKKSYPAWYRRDCKKRGLIA